MMAASIDRDQLAAKIKRIHHLQDISTPSMAALRQMTAAERLAIAWGLWRDVRDILRTLVATDHPDWTENDIHREAARRLIYDDQD